MYLPGSSASSRDRCHGKRQKCWSAPTFWIYYWALSVVFISMAALSLARGAEDYDLFILGVLSFAAASIGRTARRRRWQSWVQLHISGMGASYVLLLTAFYVDNGKNLPIWRELPQLAFWILPTVIGAPILVHALLRHPVARRSMR